VISYLLVLASGLLGGVIGGIVRDEVRHRAAMRRMLREIESEFHVKRVDGQDVMVIPWDVKTATVTHGWRKMPDA